MQPICYNIAFSKNTLLQEAKKGMNSILHLFPEFKEKAQNLLFQAPWTDTKQLDEAVQHCEAVLTSLEAHTQKLEEQKQIENELRHALQQTGSTEPRHIVEALCEGLEKDLEYLLRTFDENFKNPKLSILENVDRALREKLGGYVKSGNVQKDLESINTTLETQLDGWRQSIQQEVKKRFERAQNDCKFTLTSTENQLQQNLPYFRVVQLAQAYLETVEPPDVHIQRVDEFRQALCEWKDYVEENYELLANDSFYQECLESGAPEISSENKETFLRLFGKYGTDLKARLGEDSKETRLPPKEWKQLYADWQGQTHFTNNESRDIFEHACEWLVLILPTLEGNKK